MESLERWMEVLWKHINNLNLSSTLVKEMRDRCKKQCVCVLGGRGREGKESCDGKYRWIMYGGQWGGGGGGVLY